MPSAKKYKLFSQSADGGRPICAFFNSPDGCRNGDSCSFSHEKPDATCSVVPQSSETTSVVSSEESEDESQRQHNVTKNKNEKASATQQEKKRKSTSTSDVFSNPKSDPRPTKKTKAQELKPTPTKNTSQPSTKNSFQSLLAGLPVASFSVSNSTANPKKKESATNPPSANEKSKILHLGKYQLPLSTEDGKYWLDAVKHSQKHERFAPSLDFQKMKESFGVGNDWIKAKEFGSWCRENPQAIAIDCEMCETQDPLSGNKNSKALCRFSVVNATNPDEVLIDTLVKPVWPVIDYRTRINGITQKDLENVSFTLRHAQAFMMALCSEETVIVGHAVHNDLVALNMEHYCIADSAYLFKAKDSSSAAVSLKDLVASIFQQQMPETHDSVNDSRMALNCVKHWVDKKGKVDDIERSVKNRANQLFIHRIPKQCKAEHLAPMFLKHTSIEPTQVDKIEFSGDTGKTHVTFKSTRHANLAFETLETAPEQDKSGRLQKKVYLRDGSYVRVRKMTHSHGLSTPQKSAKSISK